MQLLEEDEETANAANLAGAAKEQGADAADGPDAEWNRRMKEKLERMKAKKMRDMSITVTQKVGLTGTLASRQRKRYGEEKVTGQGRVREELVHRQGTIEFLTGEEDGSVDICIQSIVANRNSPSRIALNVTMSVAAERAEEETRRTAERAADNNNNNMGHEDASNEMSRLERDLQTLGNRVRAILNNADFNKDQEVAFHDQSIAMSRAAQYWPMIQVAVILIAGFTQANHIVQYMRTHHIGI